VAFKEYYDNHEAFNTHLHDPRKNLAGVDMEAFLTHPKVVQSAVVVSIQKAFVEATNNK